MKQPRSQEPGVRSQEVRRPPSVCNETWNGAAYTFEELEFLKAIDRYKRENRRPYPTWVEVLDVLRSLGWRKES